jgi:uncharacterized metal-binding protein YceD (DUF177 family)
MKKNVLHIPIRISGIADGQHDFALTAEPADIGLSEEFPTPIDVRVHMDKTHAQIILTIDVASSAVFPCDRCLDPITVPVTQHFVLMYARDIAAARTLDDDEVRLIDSNAAFIDIGDDVREYALLSIPMRRICGEDADGKPLCKSPISAEIFVPSDARVDPRWEKLRLLSTE